MKKRKNTGRSCIGTIAWYGPDDRWASKVVAAVHDQTGDEVIDLQRWMSGKTDVRYDEKIGRQVTDFLKQYNVRQVVCADRIIGCPHEEGHDYPKGQDCPFCPFWAGRNRWTGEVEKQR
jgi:hypothetical protein